MYWGVLVLLCVSNFVRTAANSLKDPYICGQPSCIASEKFKYLPQVIYHYEYKANVNTWFAGSSNNRSTLDIKTAVIIQFITPCEGLIQLDDIHLIDQDDNYPVERAEKFIFALSAHTLRFAFHDGIISEICPEAEEEEWVLNFKRAILSLFQNSMKRFDINFKGIERDIHGTCNVDYTVRGQENTSLIIVKTRDLTECTDRYKYMSILQTVRYNFQSKFQTWPVLKSESKCRLTIDHNIYTEVNCKERHLFEPFSGKQSGAMTTVIQDLILVKELNKTDSQIIEEKPKSWDEITLRSNLLHSHYPYGRPSTGELKSARDVLKLLCKIKEIEDDSGPATTVDENLDSGSIVGLWGSLVRASRGLHYPALSQLLTRAPSICPRAKKHILDALPYIASEGSVELIKDMIIKNEVDKETKQEWLMSMAMIPRPKLQMLQSMMQLLALNSNDKVISFTVSSMVHSYCKHSGKSLRECCDENILNGIVEIFQNTVNTIKQKDLSKLSRADRTDIIISLKALGNIGGFKSEFSDILLDIISDALTPIPIRLTAIDAFRKTPCIETREYFLEMYREHNVDVEVRIASYLQVMRCPKLGTIRKIFHALRNEKVNQVATFVWSHLNNLGQSSLPSRVEIQGLLSGNTVPQLEDSPDFRMFSRNYEHSIFFDQYNAGGNYEANVVFSPDSYIPRMISLNLTVDMFGESINLLELKARGEGFEHYFEQLFGNEGPLSKNKINERLQSVRLFRSINDANEAREKIDGLDYENEALKHQFPMAELGIKVFGNEISYWSAEGDDEIRKSLAKLNPQMRILEILSGKEISYNKASLFLDTTFSVPTGCGLPLTMNLMGTSYVNMKMSGTVVDQFFDSGSLDFQGKIHPSVALNVAATMGVVAGTLTSTGIRLNMRLYTATALEANFKIRGLKLMHLDLSLPYPKQEIFGAKSELIILHGDKEMQQMGLNQNRIERKTCSWYAFDTAIGIQICAAYQFPNMENLVNAPYFLLSGPSKYLISLDKADPSAKTYSFRYTWDSNNATNVFNFSFDTPNSKEKRMFNTVLSLSQNTSTALVLFQSAKKTLKAHGTYRNLPYDKSLEMSLDVDGQKHFDANVSLTRHDIKYGYVWIPQFLLIVNDTKVAALSGVLKVKSKGGVTQWDISTEFQTKQLASKLIGYYTINGPTNTARLQLDYQFQKSAKHTIKLESLYSERIMGLKHDMYGELGMEFSAYPGYDFFAVLRNVRTQTHTDIKFNVSENRDSIKDPKMNFEWIKIEKMNGMKLDTKLIINRPKPIKAQFKYEQVGAQYYSMALLNFNPKSRNILISGALYNPPGNQLYIDAALNMTLPTLHPLTLKTRVHEKNAHEYQVNAAGIWFTGVDFNIDALYQDQSKTNLASHRLKILINSNHFKEIAADARFTQDNTQITFIGQGEYNDEQYRTLIRYVLLSEQNFTTYAEINVAGKAYSINLNADLNNNTIVNMDMHFDQLRDIHISYQRWVTAEQKRLSAVFNWDANRDPSQKVSIDVQLNHKSPWNHAGQVDFYYPGRLINGEFEFLIKDWFCQWHIRMGWSPEEIILWKVKLFSEVHEETIYALLSNMNTPFGGWRDTSFNVMWRYHDNLQAINGSMNWQEDYLAFSLLADYLFKTNEFYGEISAVVNSTIPTLPRAAAIAKHKVIWKKSADTLLSFQYNEDGLMMINSSWLLDRGDKESNITGRVTLLTPFQGYRKGFLRTKFVLGHKRDIKGITYLDLEEKVLKIYVDGHMRRITNCMLVVNVTSPVTEFSHMSARFGFIEADRHLVAMVVTPNTTTGLEVLLMLKTMQDFHIFGHVALPIQYLTRAILIAKRAKEEADFRVGWGNMDFGFTGIWHYQSPINFEYLYKLYTPLEGFEENGCVLKNFYGNGLDTEFSVRLSKHKFGIAILLKDNGKGLLDVLKDSFQHDRRNPDMFLENFDTMAHVTLDPLYYPTITFNAHLIKFIGADEEDILELNATLNLPEKPPIVLTDIFILEEYTVMRNTLHLSTPFTAVKELKSTYTVDITLGEKFNITSLTLLYNGTYWHEFSAKIYYEYETGIDNVYQSYLASLGIVTPLVVLPALESTVSVRLEDSLWKMSADIAMPSFTINAIGRLELDDPFVETSGSLNMTSLYLENYFIKMEFKKDFSDTENVVGGGIQIIQGNENNYMFADVLWRPPPSRYIKFKAKAALVPVLPDSDLTIVYVDNRDDRSRVLTTDLELGSSENYYSLKADQKANFVSVSLSSPHKGLRAVKLIGEIDDLDVRGSLVTDSIEYGINGKILNKDPLEMALSLIPKGQGERYDVRIKCDVTATQYSISASFIGPLQFVIHAKTQIESNYTDLYFKVDIPRAKFKEMYLKARMDAYPGLRRVVSVQAATPLKQLHYFKGDTDFVFGPKTGYVLCKYDMPDMKGDGDLKWSFKVGDLFIKAFGHHTVRQNPRSVDLDIYFGNSTDNQGLVKRVGGFRMDLDNIWQIGANASIGFILNKKIALFVNAILPKPNVDVHTFRVDINQASPNDPSNSLDVAYTTDITRIVTGLKGKVTMLPDTFRGNASIIWTGGGAMNVIDNIVYSNWDQNGSLSVDYTLFSPMYANEETFKAKGSYKKDLVHDFLLVNGLMHKPGSCRIGEIDIKYGGMKHTDGHFNVTTPFKNLLWLKSIFDITNGEESSLNRIELFWPNKSTSMNTSHKYTKQSEGFTQSGEISLEIPLSTKHLVNTQYHYVQESKFSRGDATVDFDGERFGKGFFKQVLSKSQRNLDLATTDIEVENAHTPVGVKYIHEYDETGNTDVKQATVFHLTNASRFNVTGKIDSFSWETGKNLKLMAIHGNRTLTFENEYEAKDKDLKQGSKIKWAKDVWFNYDIHITNMTNADMESQRLVMNVWYPLRTFNLIGVYNLQDNLLDGKAQLNWNVKEENKTAELKAKWENPPTTDANVHNIGISLAHPSFSKDVTLKGYYISTPIIMSNISLELQYSDYESEYLRLNSILQDNSNGPIRDYKFALTCSHPETNLDLEMKSEISIHSRWYYYDSYYRFQKNLFYQKLRHNRGLIDMRNNLINYVRENETDYFKLNGTWILNYPEYKVLVWANRTAGNDTGVAVLSMKNKSLIAHLNSTDDVSYHLIGMIVDTRSAKLNAWRDYDDVSTVDLSSYIRLNHSRLLTSSILWRPEIPSEIKGSAVYALKQMYSQINETLTILKEAPMEAHLALRNVWTDAKPRIKDFLDDLNDLHVIKDDLDEFELFLNTSYNDNDFYVKDIVEFTYYVLDEMAIRNHLESLPGILNDMWGMMGNTSKSIKESLIFVVDTIKKAYANFLETANKVLEADLMELVSERLEAAILQYDNFVRDLHMRLLEYWETTWVNATGRLMRYWKNLLKSMEPMFFKFLHYTESFVFTIWRSVMDFFYNRTHELTDSPYFNYVSTFGHEMDRFYKDLRNNDLVTNIKKYTKKIWSVVWTKIEKYIPFKDEIVALYSEFKNALESFMQTEQVVYVREKYKEVHDRLKWWYDYFLIGKALDKIWDIFYVKVLETSRTALQYEEEHRTPKTNFIFDPRKGEILLEQKLPMSWHAFNRTPDFSEISEYKAVKEFMNEWLTTNKSLWSYYYEIRPYMDINNVVPPFGGMAMMTGQGTIVTYDKVVFTISDPGTFLLTKDYKQDNVTVLMESNDQGRYNLVVLTKKNLIHVDLYREQVSIGNSVPLTLPAIIDEYTVDRQADTLTIEGNVGIVISCNFLFKTCKLKVSGWYFATLGGLFGTFNNEQFDDMRLPNNTNTEIVHWLGYGWNIEADKIGLTQMENHEYKNDTQCEKFFRNKVSPLHPCFAVIDSSPFFDECLSGVDACALASAYLETCSQQHVPIHIPEPCVQCVTPQGDEIEEGTFYELKYVPKSADIVFVIEAQYCNKNLRKLKNMDIFVEAFDSKIQGAGIIDNRYAIVGYGGTGVYRRPRALYVNNMLFTDPIELSQHFDNFFIEKSDLIKRNETRSADVFAALSFAASLPCRAGVPRTIVLMPCTGCDDSVMKLDYSTIYQDLMDNSITLHILMDDEFALSKKRAAKYLFGVDSTLAYTNKDYERLVGDSSLRKQVKLPKDKLGVCTSLAMESNGTIFAGKKLQGERGPARRFSTVFGGRAAQSVHVCESSARCECREAALHCRPCGQGALMMGDLSSFLGMDEFDDMLDNAMDSSLLASTT